MTTSYCLPVVSASAVAVGSDPFAYESGWPLAAVGFGGTCALPMMV